ncbi:MAG: hypothetical protein ACLGIC_07570 [Acidimicrobiia bacterium]
MAATLLVVPPGAHLGAQEAPATAVPNTFGLRLEGFAVEATANSTATGVAPRSAYSYAKVSSTLDLDGSRGLDMEARGANSQDAGLVGVVLFSGGDVPINGNNLPGYTQAFFPTFEGFAQVSEKCAFNQTEAKETPECREQDGPYAFSQVVPDQAAPTATGIGRTQDSGDAGGDARSESRIEPQPDGSIRGVQVNRGSDQRVPGTPITVDSYVAEQTVVAALGSATAEVRCAGEVSVGGQQVSDNQALQELLAPLTIGSDLRVTFEPATEPEIRQLPGGALEATCRGPRFTVFSSPQGGTGATYTFGKTFAAVGITENREPIGASGSLGGGGFTPPATDTAAPAPPRATGSTASSTGTSPVSTPAAEPAPEAAGPTEEVPLDDGSFEEASAPELVREAIDTTPIGAFTAVGGALLALGVWLLLGVTGSLARGLPTLRLPPFDD